MKLDLKTQLVKLDGTPLPTDDGKGQLGVRDVLTNTLLGHFEQEQPQPDGAEKTRRYHLAREVLRKDVVSISETDRVMLKKLVSFRYTPLVVGQMFDILEGIAPEPLRLADDAPEAAEGTPAP